MPTRYHHRLLLLFFLCLVHPGLSKRDSSSTKGVTIIWTEEPPSETETKTKRENFVAKKPPRRWICLSKRLTPKTKQSTSTIASQQRIPHELRTNIWELRLKWKRPFLSSILVRPAAREERFQLEFADNGFVRQVVSSSLSHEDGSATSSTSSFAIGTWSSTVQGVSWNLQLNNNNNNNNNIKDDQTLEFHSQLLLNTFGSQPRMIRGVVLVRDKGGILHNTNHRRWFCPVVGTFAADGVGEDTADLSYRGRGR